MPVDKDAVRLRHMLEAAREAVSFTDLRRREDLDEDPMLAYALVRLLEIVGEAAKHVSSVTRRAHPHLPWQAIGGARDKLIHAYFDVDLDIIWEIVTVDLPLLIDELENILTE